MKKLLALLLAVVLCLSFAACASAPKDDTANTADTTTDAAKDDTAANTEDPSDASQPVAAGGKNIVWAG